MKTNSKEKDSSKQSGILRFTDNQYRLSMDEIREQTGHKAGMSHAWYPASLQFISYQDGLVSLRNTCKQKSYLLTLAMKPEGLQTTCNCSDNNKAFCEHIYGALQSLIWELGDGYFKKLLPDGYMELAFKHRQCFDRKESRAGLDVSVREELQTVFHFDDRIVVTDLPLILNLPAADSTENKAAILQEERRTGEDAICYLWIVPYRNRFQPFVVPSAGKLNKAQTEVKHFYEILSALQKPHERLLTAAQHELNKHCFALWQMAEPLTGKLIDQGSVQCQTNDWIEVFNCWRYLMSRLSQQAFVYAYFLHRVEQLKKDKPSRQKATRITVSNDVPQIAFSLTDKDVYHQFRLVVLINGEAVQDYEADTSFFITQRGKLYLLGSLRDAAILQWMDQLDGVITVFEEHFEAFEQTILTPIRQYYQVSIYKTSKP